jgi:hypothetical protein
MNYPACMDWPVPDEGTTLEGWHVNLCAFCGRKSNTVLDHDHETGMTRGYICRRCNRIESVSHGDDHPLYGEWQAWRAGRNPATILGVAEPYNGFGWVDGVNLLDRYFGGEPTFDELQAAINLLPSIA